MSVLCESLNVSRSAYYTWRQDGASPRKRDDKPIFAIQGFLPKKRQDQHTPTVLGLAVLVGDEGRREAPVLLMVLLHRQPDLLQVLDTLLPSCCLSPLLYCR